jgi:hypothetical protein
MPNFSPDQCTFNDGPGMGAWDVAHHREHLQFVQVLSGQTPAIVIPDFDFLSFLISGSSRNSISNSHMDAHNLLRQITGAAGVDYTEFHLDQQEDFYDFLGYHAAEHAQIRQVLGIT